MIDFVDLGVLNFFQSLINPIGISFFQIITFLGNPIFWFLIVAWIYWQGREKESFFLMNIMLYSMFVVGIIKPLIARARPENILATDIASNYSFPSGHATLITSIVSYCWVKAKNNWKIIGIIAVILVGLSRMYLQAHYLTDVLSGIALGIIIGLIAVKIKKHYWKHEFKLSLIKEEVLLVLVLFVGLALVYSYESIIAFSAILGYYVGFFTLRELSKRKESNIGIFSLQFLPKQVLGFIVLGLIFIPTLFYTETDLQFLLYFIGGLWVSFLYPLLLEKGFKRKALKK
ncbi:MAG: phosphatase PAP2 family protein [archaeon]